MPEYYTGPAFFQLDNIYVVTEGPQIRIRPEDVEYSRVEVGDTALAAVTASNIGTEDLIISSVAAPDVPFTLHNIPQLPLTIPPGQSEEFQIQFSPLDEETAVDSLLVVSNDPMEDSILVTFTGQGIIFHPAESGISYASTGNIDGGRLLAIDRSTGAGTLIGLTGLAAVPGIAINSSGEMYATDNDRDGNIYRIDAENGTALLKTATELSRLFSIAFDRKDRLHGVARGPNGASLYIIDPEDGSYTLIGSVPDYFRGLAFSPVDNSLWASTNDGAVYRVDPGNGHAAFINQVSDGGIKDLHFDEDGNLFGVWGTRSGPISDVLISIDTETGSMAAIGNTNFFSVSGLAARLPLIEGKQIALFPNQVDFGKVAIERGGQVHRITIRSAGTNSLTISGVSNPERPFHLENLPAFPASLNPGDSLSFDAVFSPIDTGIVAAEIEILSDDLDSPMLSLGLTGDGLRLNPAEFGICYATLGNNESEAGSLIQIDLNTGAGTLIGPTGIVGEYDQRGVSALAIKSTGEMYATGVDNNSGLWQIDAVSGSAVWIADLSLDGAHTLAFGLNDQLYAIDGDDNLFQVDDSTGAADLIGATGTRIRGMAFDPATGTMWGSGGSGDDGIYTLNILTGNASLVGHTGFGGSTPDIHFDSAGNLFGAKGGGGSPNYLISIDKNNGSSTLIGGIGFQAVSGMASRLEKPAGSQIGISPASIDFGKAPVGIPGEPQKITIFSIGTEDLIVTGITEPIDPFLLSNMPGLPLTIPPGESASFNVTFLPLVNGTVAAPINIASNDTGQPTSIVDLKGTGYTPPTVSLPWKEEFPEPVFDGLIWDMETVQGNPENIDRNGVAGVRFPYNLPSEPYMMAINGESSREPSDAISTGYFDLSGNDAQIFSFLKSENDLEFGEYVLIKYWANDNSWQLLDSLAGTNNGSGRFEPFEFKAYLLPDDALHAQARFRFEAAPGMSYSDQYYFDDLQLASGVKIGFHPQKVNFGRIPHNSPPDTQVVSILNVGTENLTISDITLAEGAFSLSEVPGLPAVIPPQNAQAIKAVFSPSSPGGATATISVTSNDPDNPTSEIILTAIASDTLTFIVNSTGDAGDSDLSDGICDDGSGHCTLRAAIEEANENANFLDRIHFNIPGEGPHTIRPANPLPAIIDSIIIDGTTEPDFQGTPVVELDGSNAGTANGIEIYSGASTIRGVVINRFSWNGIVLFGEGKNQIQGSFLGTDISGTAALKNGISGLHIADSPNNIIGGTNEGAGNLLSGNDNEGISIEGNQSVGNLIQGNLIGTDVTGTLAVGNGNGISIVGRASFNIIGGTLMGARNIISGNSNEGIAIEEELAAGNIIQGNFIGTDISGTLAVPNSTGLLIEARYNTIGGKAENAGNVISGNQEVGLVIDGVDNRGNIVQGNLIGTDVSGMIALPNLEDGIFIDHSPKNLIGGIEPGTRNVISGNLTNGLRIDGDDASENLVQGNFIGCDISGTSAIPNGGDGITITEAPGNIIGGLRKEMANVISGNAANGIDIIFSLARNNVIQGNLIGIAADGVSPLGNQENGVLIRARAINNVIGGSGGIPGECATPCNRIAFNGFGSSPFDGVRIANFSTTGNAVLGNQIFQNANLGIALEPNSGFPNDPGDGDNGPNNRQNYSDIAAATLPEDGELEILYRVDSDTSHSAYPLLVQFFKADSSAQGALFLGEDIYNTEDFVNGSKTANLGNVVSLGITGTDSLVATVTDFKGNTSEFSPVYKITPTGFWEQNNLIPSAYYLYQNFPNPFNPTTTIRYDLSAESTVKLHIYNVLGQLVRVLIDEKQAAGGKKVIWDGRDQIGNEAASGIYIYRLQANDYVASHKMLLIR